MKLDSQKVDDAILALLCLGLHAEGRGWKVFDWDALERLHEQSSISKPCGTAKSMLFIE